MSACFCTGACRITGCCGGVKIDTSWPKPRAPYYCELEPWKGPQMPPPTSSQPEAGRGSWVCPHCLTAYAWWVSKCECQKRVVVTTGNSTNAPLPFTGVQP